MAVRTYTSSVRVGNWCEDLVLEEVIQNASASLTAIFYFLQDLVKDFLDKKENNQLLIQKSTDLLHKLLEPVSN